VRATLGDGASGAFHHERAIVGMMRSEDLVARL